MNALNKIDDLLKSGVPFSGSTHGNNCALRDERLCSQSHLQAQRPPLAVPPVMPAGFIENLKQKSPEDLPEALVNACMENSGVYAWGEKQTEIQLFGIKSVAGSEYHACAQWVWFAEYASEAA